VRGIVVLYVNLEGRRKEASRIIRTWEVGDKNHYRILKFVILFLATNRATFLKLLFVALWNRDPVGIVDAKILPRGMKFSQSLVLHLTAPKALNLASSQLSILAIVPPNSAAEQTDSAYN